MNTDVSSFQQRLWVAQRVGWVVMSIFLVFAALGATGGEGPFNQPILRSADGSTELRYQRIQRAEQESEMEWRIAAPGEKEVAIDLDEGFRSALTIERLDPEPDQVEFAAGYQRLVFRSTPDGRVRVR